ncbi:MAG: porin [Fodinibius sp.]|nr:porin [Fodinibius sp.]
MNNRILLTTTIAVLLAAIIVLPRQSHAQEVLLDTDTGWTVEVSGAFPVFLVTSNTNNYSSNGDDQVATRIMSGFNPANITVSVHAPTQNGINVSGIFQINNHLQGPSIQNDGLFESRIADIIIAGDFGTFNAGKGFGIFNSSSIADAGSGLGIGRFGGPDAANATLGRIGTGYTYANFNPRITYTTPDMDGLSLKVGLINPEKPGGTSNRSADIETATPRIEGQVNYLHSFDSGSAEFWASGLYQQVDVVAQDYSYNFSGWEIGSKLSVDNFVLQGSYSHTNSIGADGLIGLNISGGSGLDQANIDGTQWYGEATYNFGDMILGASYGEGSQQQGSSPVGSAPDITNKLAMAFARFTITDNLQIMLELQDFASQAQANYRAAIVGTQLTF